ncbi:putative Late nodulin [Medicago truncatula]|uniref:Nodule Cysteine-Rich (NCR) secreted peptide n=1 Tax=Medicago truncatula TaxID=3880 RepID=A0A072VJU2_MEDTR|nr:Nodule Cysteine-Rich (NCR) secreted peptide [Medicago truncatula]RHN74650.1 putative Late nodulin [Medicago truncatula]
MNPNIRLFYALIIFLSLLLILTDGGLINGGSVPCLTSFGCPRSTCYPPSTPNCIRRICECI